MNQTVANRVSPRKIWVAVTLSFFFPGLGHIYAGKFAKGILLAFLCAIPFFFLISLLALQLSWAKIPLLILAFLGGIIIPLYAIIDSCFQVRKAPPDYQLKEYNRWYVYFLLVLMGTGSGTQYAIQSFQKSFTVFHVSNPTMYPTFMKHDRFMVSSAAYNSSDPQRGNVVVFSNPEDRKVTFVRRVVALAGDTVEIKKGRLIINGQPLPLQKVSSISAGEFQGEVFTETNGPAKYKIFLATHPTNSPDLPKFTVPQHHGFVLADNRNQARDSRSYGPIPYAALKGRAEYLYNLLNWSRLGKL